MANSVKQDPHGSRGPEEPDFITLKDWGLKARISRENTRSRRFSALNINSFKQDAATSFRSNFNISSTASSPGYTLRGEIDPSTYSFTTALKALQAKTVYSWEYLDGFTLNSKWNEAEKYICNPLSGEVPLECLSAKTLSGRSFRNLINRITMSAPLIYPSSHTQGNVLGKSPINEHENEDEVTSKEKKVGASATRDVGTQSTLVDVVSSGCPSPKESLEEKMVKIVTKDEDGKPPVCTSTGDRDISSKTEVQVTETNKQHTRKRNGGGERKSMLNCRYRCSSSSQGGGGCRERLSVLAVLYAILDSWLAKRSRDRAGMAAIRSHSEGLVWWAPVAPGIPWQVVRESSLLIKKKKKGGGGCLSLKGLWRREQRKIKCRI